VSMTEEFIVGTVNDDDWVPGLLLTFEPEWWATDPGLPQPLRTRPGRWAYVRPVEVGVVMTTIEEIFLASIRADLPPPEWRSHPEWAAEANPRSLTMHVDTLRMGSPLQVLLDTPTPFYVPAFAFFTYGLARVLGAPYRAAASFERARQSYYEARHESAKAKDAWLEHKAGRVQRDTTLRLRAVDVELPRGDHSQLPMEAPDDA